MTWKATGDSDLPLTSGEREWDGDTAKDAIFEWAGWPDDKNPTKARKAFFAVNEAEADEKQSYKLPFATVIDGEVKAVPRGIQAVAVVLEGGRGGVDLPKAVISDVRTKVRALLREDGGPGSLVDAGPPRWAGSGGRPPHAPGHSVRLPSALREPGRRSLRWLPTLFAPGTLPGGP